MAKYKEIKDILYDMWYLVMPSNGLKRGQTEAITIDNRGLVVGRDNTDTVFCLRDICPHRAVPLSEGSYDGVTIECCYHGWCFNSEGQCTKIPALGPESDFDTRGIKVFSYPVVEKYGGIWIYLTENAVAHDEVKIDALPEFPISSTAQMRLVSSHELKCDMDNAVIGLIDPSHVPSVHGSWLWRSKRKLKQKEKHYLPYRRGFVMKKHTRKFSGILSWFLRRPSSTEISFQLPGVRVEHITYGKKNLLIVLALYPVHERLTILKQYSFTDIALVKVLFPALKIYGTRFLEEDVEVVRKQSRGLAENPKTMLVGDADRLAIWYYNLKEAHQEGHDQFDNPIPESTLRWWT